ncbi:hypothetical protein C6401_15285 [Arthrobacter woluwensis]|uniref:hypothetical protein n=1 Tax=Arthrobacter woluwensis TaxID=156980 RepID=UPI000D125BD7|nr:hypothetical protein [Arthrobacter woluwensis]PSS42918.1 hypothetical protein C6401_15285 [Arthrobacter woluwensis]
MALPDIIPLESASTNPFTTDAMELYGLDGVAIREDGFNVRPKGGDWIHYDLYSDGPNFFLRKENADG